MTDLGEVTTSDLIDELIKRKFGAHDYQLIWSNHVRELLREHQAAIREHHEREQQRYERMERIRYG